MGISMNLSNIFKEHLENLKEEQKITLECIKVFKGAKKGTLFHVEFCVTQLAHDGVIEKVHLHKPSLLLYEGDVRGYGKDITIFFKLVATQSNEPLNQRYQNKYNESPLASIEPLKDPPSYIVPLEDLPTYMGYKCIFPPYRKLIAKLTTQAL
jgi:hypothetical protein